MTKDRIEGWASNTALVSANLDKALRAVLACADCGKLCGPRVWRARRTAQETLAVYREVLA